MPVSYRAIGTIFFFSVSVKRFLLSLNCLIGDSAHVQHAVLHYNSGLEYTGTVKV